MRHTSHKRKPVLTSGAVVGPAEGYVGDPPQKCTFAGTDQYGQPIVAVATARRSSDPAIASIDVNGWLVDLAEGDVIVQAQVNGSWWD